MTAGSVHDVLEQREDTYLSTLDSILSYGPAVAIAWELSEAWPVTFVSPNIEQFGYDPEAFTSGALPYADIIHPDDLARIADQVASAIASGSEHSVQRYRIRTASGEVRWLADYTTFLRDREGVARTAQGILIDVTLQVATEERATSYIEAHPNPMFTLDRQGRVCVANDAAEGLLADAATLEGSDREKYEAVRAALSATTVPEDGYYAFADRVFRIRSTPSTDDKTVNIYAEDVTDSRHRELLLDDLRENLYGVLLRIEMSEGGKHAMTVINPERLIEIGLPVGNADGNFIESLWDATLDADLERFKRSLEHSAETLGLWVHEWRVSDREGRERWLRGTGEPLRHTDGSTTWMAMIMDITAQRTTARALASALEQTIDVIADAVEMRDAYTAGHQRNVATLSVAIAREVGLDEHRINGLRLAAAVHDVGKIRIPIEVLSKPDRLTPVEYNLIKQHSAFGGELLERIDSPWPLAEIVRQHHERVDGSGYPDGLAGDDILIEARIIAVADVLEAISSARPYRPARGLSAAQQELMEGRGRFYDPRVIDACLALIDRGDIGMDGGSAKVVTRED